MQKTYGFTCGMRWVGGSGVVRAESKEKAVILVNITIEINEGTPITEADLIEVKPNSVELLTNGDY